MRICVIFNPAARGEKAERFRAHLGELARQCVLRPTTAVGAGSVLAAQAVEEGFDVIVAAGGDGTVNEVLNGIGSVPEGFARVRLGVLPLGTMNVFARELGLPLRVPAAWEVIQEGRELLIDVAVADYSAGGEPRRRYFVQMAGAGADARAIGLVSWERKKRFGSLAYVLAGLQALRGPQPPILASDGGTSVAGPLVLIGNGRFYGGRFRLFPLADFQDGVLEVTVFTRLNWSGVICGCWGVLSNRLHSAGGVRHFKGPCVSLNCASPEPFHVEGENVGLLPARFSVQRQVLRVSVG